MSTHDMFFGQIRKIKILLVEKVSYLGLLKVKV